MLEDPWPVFAMGSGQSSMIGAVEAISLPTRHLFSRQLNYFVFIQKGKGLSAPAAKE